MKNPRLLASFPRPPGAPTSSPDGLGLAATPGPNLVYRASDFGVIDVGLYNEAGDISQPADPQEPTTSEASVEAIRVETPSPILGDLQLILDDSTRVFSPQETITGYISGWDSSSHIHIILEGRAKTCMNSDQAQYTDVALLLYNITHLRPEAQAVNPRFSITIPKTTHTELETLSEIVPANTLYEHYWPYGEWPVQNPYECQPGHPLPPSISMPWQTSYKLTSTASGRATIDYRLIAVRSQFDNLTKKLVPEASYILPIWLTTRRLPVSKVPELTNKTRKTTANLEVRTRQLAQASRPSLCGHLVDSFGHNTPSFYFVGNVSIPPVSIPRANLTVSISVSVLPPPAGRLYNFPVPDISVSSFACRLHSYTGIRILRSTSVNPDRPLQPRSHTFKSCELQQSKKAQNTIVFIPENGNYNGQSCRISIALPKSLTPSFKTYNVWRAYRLECDVIFRVAEKEVTVYAQSDVSIIAKPASQVVDVDVKKVDVNTEDDHISLEMAKAVVQKAPV